MLFIKSMHISVNRPLKPYRLAIDESLGIISVINKSINVLCYYLFILRFKGLLHKKTSEDSTEV